MKMIIFYTFSYLSLTLLQKVGVCNRIHNKRRHVFANLRTKLVIALASLISSFSLFGQDFDLERQEYLKNLASLREFKKHMSSSARDYYLPRKRFIDRQSINPSFYPYNQLHILTHGAYIRSKYMAKNGKEIKKLELFLEKADDFQLNRYFGDFEEIYLRSNAKKSIQHIRETADRDEKWRLKNDPIFATYLYRKATPIEKKYYSQNKFLFYGELTGHRLISFLKAESRASQLNTISMTDSNID